jgi:hypothetical protein
MTKYLISFACVLLALAGIAQAQSNSGTTNLSVVVGPEAALSVTTGTTTLANTGTAFAVPYTGSTALTYKIRTTKTGGTGTITLKVTADFAGSGGPSVGTPPTAGDALTYTNTVSSPGTATTGTLTASASASTNVGSFGAGASSTFAGNTASVAWSLTNDPLYATGTYTATVTFTISST